MKKKIILLFTSLLILALVKAQDIIIKKDKSEIKAKVLEITADKIKYNKWDMKEGPVYNISKTEVFMIIYQNGQREIISSADPQVKSVTPQPSNNNKINQPQEKPTSIDTTIDWVNTKVKYAPSRILVGLNSFTPITASFDQEIRILKNIVNAGLSISYIFIENSTPVGFVYASGYLPVNRMSKKFEEQDKGLFVYLHGGLLFSSVQIPIINYQSGSITYENEIQTAFGWNIGADYFFGKRFGIAVKTSKFKSFSAGIVTSF